MGLVRAILRPLARVAAMHAGRQLRAFLLAHERTVEVQEQLLRRMIAAATGSGFARDHRFDRIRSYADFVSAVPVGDYETHRAYIDRVLNGEVGALFAPGTEVIMFAVTSGTTGAPKHIPVTPRFLRACRRGWNTFGLLAMKHHPDTWLRKIVTIGSSPREHVSPTGIPCGAISGLLADSQKWIVRKMYPVPSAARDVHDPLGKYYTMVRASIAHDVGMLTTANPSSAIRLAEVGRDHAERIIRDVREGGFSPPGRPGAEPDRRLSFRPDPAGAERLQSILRRHGQLLPKHYWRLAVMCHWTGGTVGLYLPRVRHFYGDVPVRDIGLLASEGRLSVPMEDETPAGVAEITSNFLEFIPAGEIASPRPNVLRVHELEIGQEYFIVLTNWAGLWRYNIDDRVRVVGRYGGTAVLEFLSRGLHTCSITGEKLTEHQVVQAMRRAAGRLDTTVETFTLHGHFADPPYYELRMEPVEGADVTDLAERLDRALRGINLEYQAKRGSGRLGPIRGTRLPPGSFCQQEVRRITERRGRGEQYKHKYLMTDVIEDSPGDR